MKGEDFTPKDKGQSFPDKTVGDTPSGEGFPTPDTTRKKRKMKLVQRFSSKPTGQDEITSHVPKAESRLKLAAGKGSGATPKLTEKQTKKLKTLSDMAVKAEEKYFKLEEKLPKRHKLKLTQKLPDSKCKVQLHFEEQTKGQKETLHLIQSPKAVLKRSASVAGKAVFSGTVDGSGVQSDQEKPCELVQRKQQV